MITNNKAEFDNEQQPVNFLTITEVPEKSRVEVNVRGHFVEQGLVAQQLDKLSSLAEKYNCVQYNINSPGGYLSTLMELMQITKKFSSVITVVTGSAQSAGFFLWCLGDIRAVANHSFIMAHRESWGYYGKSAEMVHISSVWDTLYEGMMDDICSEVLTEEEIEKAKFTEVFIPSNELIDRGVAISYDQFLEKDNQVLGSSLVIQIGDDNYIFDDEGIAHKVEIAYTDERYFIKELVFDLPTKIELGEMERAIQEAIEEFQRQEEENQKEEKKKQKRKRKTK